MDWHTLCSALLPLNTVPSPDALAGTLVVAAAVHASWRGHLRPTHSGQKMLRGPGGLRCSPPGGCLQGCAPLQTVTCGAGGEAGGAPSGHTSAQRSHENSSSVSVSRRSCLQCVVPIAWVLRAGELLASCRRAQARRFWIWRPATHRAVAELRHACRSDHHCACCNRRALRRDAKLHVQAAPVQLSMEPVAHSGLERHPAHQSCAHHRPRQDAGRAQRGP